MRRTPSPSPRRAMAAIAAHPRRWTVGVFIAAILGLLIFAILEGDLPELVQDGGFVVGHLLRRFGVPAAFGLLYAEESGVPMPMPGDVFVMYVGHHVAQSVLSLLTAWLALIAVVVLGASNLYWISARWGRSIVEHRLANLLHLTPQLVRALGCVDPHLRAAHTGASRPAHRRGRHLPRPLPGLCRERGHLDGRLGGVLRDAGGSVRRAHRTSAQPSSRGLRHPAGRDRARLLRLPSDPASANGEDGRAGEVRGDPEG